MISINSQVWVSNLNTTYLVKDSFFLALPHYPPLEWKGSFSLQVNR